MLERAKSPELAGCLDSIRKSHQNDIDWCYEGLE